VVELLSDTTFGRGGGAPGVVDVEIQHDACGLPVLAGKSLRGLLRDSWLSMQGHFPELLEAGQRVLGPHADVHETSILRIGDALIEPEARAFFIWAAEREQDPLAPEAILGTLTEVRSQTAEERATGAPAGTTLRSMRVAIRGLQLIAPLAWLTEPEPTDLRCLALASLATRHGGLGRSRGRGHLRITFQGDVEGTRMFARGEV
jgi:CRISPR/Cas system CSM-associated protein Csm3 (group 7 of RAMP superfamily)